MFANAEVRRRWTYLYDRVANGEMPPPESERPSASSTQSFLRTLGGILTRADLDEREVVLRRLNRNEYTNTVSDLFGAYVDVSRVLLDDSTDKGFDNIGSELSISKEQMQTYVEAASIVLDHVFGPEKQVDSTVRSFNLATSQRSTVGSSERKLSDGVVLYSSGKHLPTYGYGAPIPGLYRYTVKVRAEQTQKPVVMQIWGGNTGQISRHSEGFFEVPVGQTRTVSLDVRAKEYGDSISFALMNGYRFSSVKVDEYKGPGLFIGDVTVEGPIHEWDETRRRLLGNVNVETGTLNDVRSILLRIMPRAFRRPIDDDEVQPYLGLARQAIDAGRGFEEALRLALQGVLCAPEFLYLEEPIEKASIDGYAIATRLSYFLWSSLPDDELTELARQGQLSQPNVLRSQVDRMLADPKSQRFVENFAGQWLRVRDIDFTVPDRNLYPEYNVLLREAMVGETYAFFREVLDNDLSVQNFIDSDFLMLNEPLAKFYEIDGVEGLDIRRVQRPAESVRGGVMTQASVLKVSADGTRTSPVLRGMWIQSNLFGRTMPPPPSTVDIIQPDIRGAETIREQLEKHRADPSCARCHNKIDPPGFALESFDVQGGFREWYRVRKDGKWFAKKLFEFGPQNVLYRQGPDVDATGTTADGRHFNDIREYKRLLLADETAMARSLSRLLLSYSLGRELGFSDRAEVERIVAAVKSNGSGLKSIVHEVVQGEVFRSP